MRTRLIVAALAFAAGAGFLPGMAHAQNLRRHRSPLLVAEVTLPYQMPSRINATLSAGAGAPDRRWLGERREEQLRGLGELSRCALGPCRNRPEQHHGRRVHLHEVFCSGTADFARWPRAGGGRDERLHVHRREPRLALQSADEKQWVQSQNMVE